ncbi:hypothetical protein [Frankia sp. QA3]|uniref:hypothetical protein n=1 Tax=Frankia sp. QA3 TaxID=710111 RepID=UPI0002F442CA|nr:hypothetical protein [Frankia sp. QA3]
MSRSPGRHGGRGWQARTIGGGGAVQVWRTGRMHDTHPTRQAAVAALLHQLAYLADHARRATLRA